MDALIKRFDGEKDDDLVVVPHRGLAYQRKMSRGRVAYDDKYLAHYDSLAGSAVERALNEGRGGMLFRHAPAGARVLDVGVGNGSFMRMVAASGGFEVKGFDINPAAVARLGEQYSEDFSQFDVVTFWDSLEHIEELGDRLRAVKEGAVVLAAVPVVEDIRKVRESKHFKPGEHLYYWTASGFVGLMALYGYRLLETSTHEIDAGRESIGAFAFKRDLPGYREHIGAYMQMHETKHYGGSATELYLNTVTEVVRAMNPKSILDFGCGRSDLISHFYLDGERRLARYDPAIPQFREMPEGAFDLVLCCDVMEHVPMLYVDKVLGQMRRKGMRAFYVISTKLARAKLPDGRNAHVTLLTKSEWTRWVGSYYDGQVSVVPSSFEHELVLLTGPVNFGVSRRMS